MRQFTVTTDIAAPPERVWEVMSDIDHWNAWTPGVTSVTRLGGQLFAVGTRVLIRQPKLPPAYWTITEIKPGRSFSWVSAAPGLRAIGVHSVEPAPGGSRATLALDLQGLLGGLWGRMTKEITERYIGYEARGLKARSENPQFRHSGM